MNRESAALGVPVYSIFRGKTGAVDKYLAENGRLIMLESQEDVRTKLQLVRRVTSKLAQISDHGALRSVVGHIAKLADGAA
jgi:predicted glycosyltransferase